MQKQRVILYLDKIRGLSKFVAEPLPVLPEYQEAIQMWQEKAALELQQFVGQMFTPSVAMSIVNVVKNIFLDVYNQTGMEIEFEHHLISPGEWDELGFFHGTPKTAQDIIREASIRRGEIPE